MAPTPVPVTLGSPEFHSASIEGCDVVHAWFPPGITIDPHIHEHATIAIMLTGSFDLRFGRTGYECVPASIAVEPAGERHSNRMGSHGAEVMVLQPSAGHAELWRPFAPLLDRIGFLRHGGITGMASRLTQEIRRPDPFSPLVIESVVLDILVSAARLHPDASGCETTPSWLLRVHAMLHEEPIAKLGASALAGAVGVHPAHLARAFRRHFRVSLGSYARRLRIDWAAGRLKGSDENIAAIAHRAGFADQSHLTRTFKRCLGVTPDQYRRRYRSPEV
jgi:AraC family transcriptional regulator